MQRPSNKPNGKRHTAKAQCAEMLAPNDRLSVEYESSPNLSAGAKVEWSRLLPVLAALGTASIADVRALELCCEALASEKELRDVLHVEGLIVQGASGGMKAHPALKALETTRSQAHRLLSDFGLTPRGRQNVEVLPNTSSENPFSRFVKTRYRTGSKGPGS